MEQNFHSRRKSEAGMGLVHRSTYPITTKSSNSSTKIAVSKSGHTRSSSMTLINPGKHISLANDIIFEPRFKSIGIKDLPKEHVVFARKSLDDSFSDYDCTGYIPPRKEMDEDHLKKWIRMPLDKKLDWYVEYFSKRPRRFWMDHDRDPAINDRIFLAQQPVLEKDDRRKWRKMQAALGLVKGGEEIEDWSKDWTEEACDEYHARLRDQIIIPKTAPLQKVKVQYSKKYSDNLEIRKYFVNKQQAAKESSRSVSH